MCHVYNKLKKKKNFHAPFPRGCAFNVSITFVCPDTEFRRQNVTISDHHLPQTIVSIASIFWSSSKIRVLIPLNVIKSSMSLIIWQIRMVECETWNYRYSCPLFCVAHTCMQRQHDWQWRSFSVLSWFNQVTSLVWLSVWLQKCLCCLHAGDRADSRERGGWYYFEGNAALGQIKQKVWQKRSWWFKFPEFLSFW